MDHAALLFRHEGFAKFSYLDARIQGKNVTDIIIFSNSPDDVTWLFGRVH